MKLKKCSCCGKGKNTKDYTKIGRNVLGLWFNCKFCNSTILLTDRITQNEMEYAEFKQANRIETFLKGGLK
jgi:hypothetical protein